MDERQNGTPGHNGEMIPAKLVAMSPTTVARWARDGRTFRAVDAPLRPEDDPAGSPDAGGDAAQS